MTPLELHPAIDAVALAAHYAVRRAVRIAPFLAPAAADALAAHLLARDDWRQHVNQGDKLFELDRASRAAFSPERRAALDAAVMAQAAQGFQFRFEALRVDDDPAVRASEPSPLNRFGDFMNSAAVLDLLRRVTGAPAIRMADAQATLYGPGDLLTTHDDAVAGKNRHAAYVCNLTRAWRIDWGGLLLLHGADSAEAWPPAWNSLSLFAVPRSHCVTMVVPFAGVRRLSVTGWLRG